MGEGTNGHITSIYMLETDGERTRDMKKYGTGAGELAGHRLRLYLLSQPIPEGGEKTKLSGELRREEQLIYRTGMCMDRVCTVDVMSEGFFLLAFRP
jgi:hypothetical protein